MPKLKDRPEGLDQSPPGHSSDLPFNLPPRGLDRRAAAAYIGVSASKFDELVRDRRMPQPVRIDGRVIWDRRALDAAFDALTPQRDDDEERERAARERMGLRPVSQ
jgi:predicted DNA-binding transcriptional regulator AlpA